MPPFEEEGHIALHLSVGRYVGWSVDQTMSAQYLENLLLDCYDIYAPPPFEEEREYCFAAVSRLVGPSSVSVYFLCNGCTY